MDLEAGFNRDAAQRIAVFSQYVDDYNAYAYRNYTDIPNWLKDKKYDVYITTDLLTNFNPPTTGFADAFDMATLMLERSQRFTVVPFHFVPYDLQALAKRSLTTREARIGDNSFISKCLEEACSNYQTYVSGIVIL